MKKIVLMMASLWICSNVNSQELTSSQKDKIASASEINTLFEKNVKSNESLDVSELTESVRDRKSVV